MLIEAGGQSFGSGGVTGIAGFGNSAFFQEIANG